MIFCVFIRLLYKDNQRLFILLRIYLSLSIYIIPVIIQTGVVINLQGWIAYVEFLQNWCKAY